MSAQSVQMINLSVKDLTDLFTNCVKEEIQKVISLTPQKQKTEKEILTREEVKDLLSISYTSLWKYNNNKSLVAKKANGRVFYMRDDVMNFLNKVA